MEINTATAKIQVDTAYQWHGGRRTYRRSRRSLSVVSSQCSRCHTDLTERWIVTVLHVTAIYSLKPIRNCKLNTKYQVEHSVSQKIPQPEIFWHFFPNGWEFLVQILHAYYTFLSTLDYKFLFNYLQLWQSYAILRATTIMCSKCAPSTETHAGWSH